MKLLLLATIKLFLLSILNVFYLYLKISMVVKSIFLFWIFPIRHLPTIITSLTLWPGGEGGGSTWLMGAPGPIMIVTRRTNLNNIIRADKYRQPHLLLLRPSSVLKMNLYCTTPQQQKLDWNRCYRTRSVIKTLFRQITIAVALIFTCLRGAICFNLGVWPVSADMWWWWWQYAPTQGRV